MTIEDMKIKIKNSLSTDRYHHSIGVMNESVKLAIYYSVDEKKAQIAGLLHDCAKQFDDTKAIEIIEKHDIFLDEIQKQTHSLYHGVLAPIIASACYGVTDREILDAICWHTTGRAGMTYLEKIVFIADYIEPGRKLDNILQARKAAYEDLNRCILMITDSSIRHVLTKGDLLHPDTVNARNDALIKVKQGVKGL